MAVIQGRKFFIKKIDQLVHWSVHTTTYTNSAEKLYSENDEY